MLQLSKYHFILEAEEEIILPAYKGSTFHGGFGRALMVISPLWYRYFFEPGESKKSDIPKPFVILPPLDELVRYPKEHQFVCELTLFGNAIQHYAIAQAAIEHLGLRLGLGKNKGKYKILDIIQSSPTTPTNLLTDNITLNFSTRLRLKAQNRLHKASPEFSLVLARLLGRLRTLENSYTNNSDQTNTYAELKYQAQIITIKDSQVKWDDWDRFSGSQKEWMKFGGLMGSISYQGDLSPFMEVLALGEWLHIGGKTSFGLGKYEMKRQGEDI